MNNTNDTGIVEYRSAFNFRYRTLWIFSLFILILLSAINIGSYFFVFPIWVFLFFLPAFSLFGGAIYDYNEKNKRFERRKAFTMPKPLIKLHIRPLIVVLLFIFAIYYFICFFSLMGFSGTPEIIDGRYALNNHGAYTYISYEQYVKACETATRVFSAILMVFTYISFAYYFCKKTRLEQQAA